MFEHYPLKPLNTFSHEEEAAAIQVIRSGVLSGFIGSAGPGFLGGKKVREFEAKVCDFTSSTHAITVNSWTSGILTMLTAVGIGPGDEVITPAWTMCATASCILHLGATPVFVDISPLDYCISPSEAERAITPNTKAIIAVDIFGYTCDYLSLRKICDIHGIYLIADSAQAWHSYFSGHHASVLADIGGFSLNYHKQIHCGEGGVIITNSHVLARRCQLIRNHGEAVVTETSDPEVDLDIVGHNFRMGEIEAAISIEQLQKLPTIVESRRQVCAELDNYLDSFDVFILPTYDQSRPSSYYKYPLRINPELLRVFSRVDFANALRNAGLSIVQEGYANVSLLPVFRRLNMRAHRADPILPVTDQLHAREYLGLSIDLVQLDKAALSYITSAFSAAFEALCLA